MQQSFTPERPGDLSPRITAIGTAVPKCPVHASYGLWAQRQVDDPRKAAILRRMMARSGIDQRYSVLTGGDGRIDFGSFYNGTYANGQASPPTSVRMERYGQAAPSLALEAIAQLPGLEGITHMVTASCTGFMAPGLDQIIARKLALDQRLERVFIGFMGCYAGVTALRTAAQIVRADPQARVLVLSVELCTLHMQETQDLESLLAMGQFADGAAAALIQATGEGLALGDALSLTLADAADLIRWDVGDTGFGMHLSGAVPSRIAQALSDPTILSAISNPSNRPQDVAWAVHPGGRSILDAVERGLGLSGDALSLSRDVLRQFGNMSSATILFVLQQMMARKPREGMALAFGPGLALEGLQFGWTDNVG